MRNDRLTDTMAVVSGYVAEWFCGCNNAATLGNFGLENSYVVEPMGL